MSQPRPPRGAPNNLPTYQQVTRWCAWLYNAVPILGFFIRRYAATSLARAAAQGSSKAKSHLAQAVRDSKDPQVVSIALSALRKTWSQPSLDIIWRTWQEKRPAYLLGLLTEINQPASNPPLLRVQSILKLNQLNLITQGPTHLIPALIEACHDVDPEIRARAQSCLPVLKHPAAVDGFCTAWASTRDPLLEDILVKSRYMARRPLALRLLTALKLDRLEIPQSIDPEGIPDLLAACTDRDANIASRAYTALTQIKNAETGQALCQQVIETGDETARKACLQAGYLPQDQVKRVVYLFLTEQWQAYQDLDFDQSMLHSVYLTASPEIRQRITHQLQVSGRTNLLPIIAGANFHTLPSIVGEEEAEVLVTMLSMQEDWKTLWRLVDEVPFRWSVQIVRLLNQKAWLLADDDERAFLHELIECIGSDGKMGEQASPAAFTFPPAVQRARVTVKGRINDIAFAPDGPYLAIGTGQRKVVLWDYQKAAIKTVHSDPAHSVGQVAYTPEGSLLCAEKSNKVVRCAISGWSGETPFYLGDHTGAITGLEPAGHGLVLSTGRDQNMKLWDLNQHRLVSHLALDDWPRSARISPDGQFALLLQPKPALISLPELRQVLGGNSMPTAPLVPPGKLTSMPRSAAFVEEGGLLLIGQSDGQIITATYKNGAAEDVESTASVSHGHPVVVGHISPVIEIECLPKRGVVISASSGGTVIFTVWPERVEKSRLTFPSAHLSALKVSPDGFFMAVGSADEGLWLLDLRTLDLPALMARPFSSFTVDHLALINMLLEGAAPGEVAPGNSVASSTNLTPESQSALAYIRLILQHRFRYDIQVSDLPMIQAGEYDIILD